MVQPDYDKLQEAMDKAGISRRKLAISTGISENSLAGSFRRRGKMQNENYRRIAEFLGVDPIECLKDELIPTELLGSTDLDGEPLLSLASIFTDYAKTMTFEGIMTSLTIMGVLRDLPHFQRKEGESLARSFLHAPVSLFGNPEEIGKAIAKGLSGKNDDENTPDPDTPTGES